MVACPKSKSGRPNMCLLRCFSTTILPHFPITFRVIRVPNPNLPSLIPLVILSSCLLPSRHLVILSVNFTYTDTRFGHECLVEKKLDVNIHEQRAYPSCATNIRLHANAKLTTIKSAPRWSLGGSFPTSVLGYPTKDNGLPPDTRS